MNTLILLIGCNPSADLTEGASVAEVPDYRSSTWSFTVQLPDGTVPIDRADVEYLDQIGARNLAGVRPTEANATCVGGWQVHLHDGGTRVSFRATDEGSEAIDTPQIAVSWQWPQSPFHWMTAARTSTMTATGDMFAWELFDAEICTEEDGCDPVNGSVQVTAHGTWNDPPHPFGGPGSISSTPEWGDPVTGRAICGRAENPR